MFRKTVIMLLVPAGSPGATNILAPPGIAEEQDHRLHQRSPFMREALNRNRGNSELIGALQARSPAGRIEPSAGGASPHFDAQHEYRYFWSPDL